MTNYFCRKLGLKRDAELDLASYQYFRSIKCESLTHRRILARQSDFDAAGFQFEKYVRGDITAKLSLM